jgi:molybdopterin converting factor small subunit
VKVKARFFGPLALRFGKEVEVELHKDIRLPDAIEYIFKIVGLGQVNMQQSDNLRGFVAVFVNGKAFDPNANVNDGDEISFYPPVTGG